jgi:hypothetical protein
MSEIDVCHYGPVRDRGRLRHRLDNVRRVGARESIRLGLHRFWSSNLSFGLSADLARSVEVRKARVPVRMEVADPGSFTGFDDELQSLSGSDALEVVQRKPFCTAGVRTLYVALDDSGSPMFAQWLVRKDDQEAFHRVTNGFFPQLGEGEALLEGAYTFMSARGQGVMADGMAQLLASARDAGDRKAYTYVDVGNIPSLRGCANVGFEPDHLRVAVRRFGIRKVRRAPVDDTTRALWEKAVAPRTPASSPREAPDQPARS